MFSFYNNFTNFCEFNILNQISVKTSPCISPRQSPGPVSMSPVLTLETVTRREAGSYQCRADNGVGPPQFKKIDLLISCELLFIIM